jgi:hypothetical protein
MPETVPFPAFRKHQPANEIYPQLIQPFTDCNIAGLTINHWIRLLAIAPCAVRRGDSHPEIEMSSALGPLFHARVEGLCSRIWLTFSDFGRTAFCSDRIEIFEFPDWKLQPTCPETISLSGEIFDVLPTGDSIQWYADIEKCPQRVHMISRLWVWTGL